METELYNVKIKCNIDIEEKEAEYYVTYLEEKHNRKLKWLDITIDNENNVDLRYHFEEIPFDRIRRITGYLTGDTKTWNNSKIAELNDRVKHSAEIEKL